MADIWTLPTGWGIIHSPSHYELWAKPDSSEYLVRNFKSGNSLGARPTAEGALNAALSLCAAGSTVFANASADYIFSGGVTIPQAHITIEGRGLPTFKIKNAYGSGALALLAATSKNDPQIRGIYFEGNKTTQCVAQTGCALTADPAAPLVPNDPNLYQHDGIDLSGCSNAVIEGCVFNNFLRMGAYLHASSNNARVINCFFYGCEGGTPPFDEDYVWGSLTFHSCGGNITISGCAFGDAGIGIGLLTSNTSAISSCTFNPGGNGIWIEGGVTHAIGACNFFGQERIGIRVEDADYITIGPCAHEGSEPYGTPATPHWSEAIAFLNTVNTHGHSSITGGTFKWVTKAVYLLNAIKVGVAIGSARLCNTNAIHLNQSDDCNIVGGVISESGIAADATYSQVYLLNSDRNLVTGLTVRDAAIAPQAQYGCHVSAGSNDNIVDSNDLRTSGVTANFQDDGAGTLGTNWT